MSLIFYTNPMSRGQIVRWMLHEVGAPYSCEIIGYGEAMAGADYGRINPMKKVPAIVHDGQPVTESAAICAYLAEAFPGAGLAPLEQERAPYYRWLFFAAGPVEQAVTSKAAGWEPGPEQQRMVGFGSYQRVMDTLAGWLEEHEHVCGDRFTAADVYVGAQVDWGLQFGTFEKRTVFERYAERMRERPAYREAKAIDNRLIAEMQASSAASR